MTRVLCLLSLDSCGSSPALTASRKKVALDSVRYQHAGEILSSVASKLDFPGQQWAFAGMTQPSRLRLLLVTRHTWRLRATDYGLRPEKVSARSACAACSG